MNEGTPPTLPWDELKRPHDAIPWPILEQFAQAAAADEEVLEGLLNCFDDFMETGGYERGTFECLYVPAIIALAAPSLPLASRKRAAAFLVRALAEAGNEQDDVMEEVLPAAAGVLGAEAVLPAVVEQMPRNFQPWDRTFGLWQLAALARETEDARLRQSVIDLCLEALMAADRGQVEPQEVESAAWPLAVLGLTDARPLIQRLRDRCGESEDYLDALSLLEGEWPRPEEAWEKPVRDWVTEQWELLREWFDEPGGYPAEAEEDEGEAAHRRASDLAGEFAESSVTSDLPQEKRDRAGSIACFLLDYAWTHASARPEDLTVSVLREVLLEVFPRKISADRGFFEDVVPRVQAFLDWLESQGLLTGSAAMREAIGPWHEQVVERGMDRRNWGMAKSFVMTAQEDGVDIEDPQALEAYMVEYNLRLAGSVQIARNADDPDADVDFEAPEAGLPFVNPTPKVGRNEPCPCGSGKKFKKCCGR